MPFQIIRNDLTKVRADAIVNSANPEPVIGRGTEMGIYMAAGREKLLAERQKIGVLEPGTAAVSPAFRLRAKYIIHTAAPEWIAGDEGERETLRNCYKNAMELASQLSCSSIAFPLLSSGSNGFPKDEAMKIALSEIQDFLFRHEMLVTLCVMDDDSYAVSRKLMGEIEAYIDSRGAGEIHEKEYGGADSGPLRRRNSGKRKNAGPAGVSYSEMNFDAASGLPYGFPDAEEDTCFTAKQSFPNESVGSAPKPAAAPPKQETSPGMQGKSLEEILGNAGETFQQRLLKLIDRSGMTDVAVYKKANIDRKVFSRIRSKVHYQPKKETAVALGIALELDMTEMEDLLARAGFAFSPSSRFDLIVEFFVNRRIFDISTINTALFDYGQPLLGSIPQN